MKEEKLPDLPLTQRERLLRNQDLDSIWGMVVSIDRLELSQYTSTAVARRDPIQALLEAARESLLKAEEGIRGLAE